MRYICLCVGLVAGGGVSASATAIMQHAVARCTGFLRFPVRDRVWEQKEATFWCQGDALAAA